MITQQNGWNDDLEKTANHFRDTFLVYKWCHNKVARRNYVINKVMENVVTGLNVLMSMGIFTGAFYCSDLFWVQILTGLIASFVTILDRVHSNLELDSSSKEHKRISVQWGELYNDIHIQLCIDRSQRKNAILYLDLIQKLYKNLLEMSPSISAYIWDEYTKKFPISIQSNFIVFSKEEEKELTHEEKQKKYNENESKRMKYEIDRFLQDNFV